MINKENFSNHFTLLHSDCWKELEPLRQSKLLMKQSQSYKYHNIKKNVFGKCILSEFFFHVFQQYRNDNSLKVKDFAQESR